MQSSAEVIDLDAPEQTHGANIRSASELFYSVTFEEGRATLGEMREALATLPHVAALIADQAHLRADLREGDLVIEGQQARRDSLDVEMTALRDSLDVERAALLAERTARLAEIEHVFPLPSHH